MVNASPPKHENAVRLAWIVRLRWGAIAAQVFTFAVSKLVMGLDVAAWPLALVVGFGVLANLGIRRWLHDGRDVPELALFAVLALDVGLLTVLLVFTGGPLNPFTFLYLIHTALATIVLPARLSWALTALAISSYFALFAVEGFTPSHDHRHMALHLKGMWVAFAIAAAFITHFVGRVRQALEQRARDDAAMKRLQQKSEQLSALATLAGGAAHELSTPLSTISVIAAEVIEEMERTTKTSAVLDDMRLVIAQVERCRGVLERLAADGGAVLGEASRLVTVASIVDDVVAGLPRAVSVTRDLDGAASAEIFGPPRAIAVALRGLVKNALEAAAQTNVIIRGARDGTSVSFIVEDQGPGIPAETLARIGEPFFTTKAPGRGMGLGVFLARSMTERLGGDIAITSSIGTGTRVTMRLPVAPAS